MKYSVYILMIIFGIASSCKRDEAVNTNKTYSDLSKGGNQYPPNWLFYTQDLDSIDYYGKPYFKKDLYVPYYYTYGFTLTSINDSHTCYQRANYFEQSGGSWGKYYYDTCRVNPFTDSIVFIIFSSYVSDIIKSNKPDSTGVFTGKYDASSNTIKGYFPTAYMVRAGFPGQFRYWSGLVYSELQ